MLPPFANAAKNRLASSSHDICVQRHMKKEAQQLHDHGYTNKLSNVPTKSLVWRLLIVVQEVIVSEKSGDTVRPIAKDTMMTTETG